MSLQLDALAFEAHPDDVELSCAGTLIKLAKMGYKTGIVSLTAGEMGTRGTPEIRQKEFDTAGKIMGLSVHEILAVPDSRVQANEENRLKVIKTIRAYTPKIVFAPYWETRHPDHAHCSHLVRESAFLSGLKKIDTGQKPFRTSKVIYYMELYDFSPSFIIDISDTFDDKIKSVRAYDSQFSSQNSAGKEEETFINSPGFLELVIHRGEYWGNKIGVKYGEPFLIREPISIDDPVKLFGEPHIAKFP
jgi:bacillithiol biosynthesis deacetylase BshB1